MKRWKIKWDHQAVKYLNTSIQYIRKDSPQNADKVKNDLLKEIRKLALRPEMNAPDKFKVNNKGEFRAFELHRFRVSYLIKKDEIIIARIRHTSQEPLYY